MASSSDWLPSRLADQAVVFENVNNKIGAYTGVLGLTAAQETAIGKLCTEFDVAYSATEQCRAAMLAMVSWRDQIFKGTPQGSPAPDPPAFPAAGMPAASTIGILAQFREFRDIILASPGYTEAIGEDLMIVASGGGSGPSKPIGEMVPDIKCQTGAGYEVNIAGPMHGMDAMRIEWQSNGDANWSLVGFLTRTPGVVHPTPKVPGQPESGRIRARYIRNNDPVGDYSQESAVTISA